MSLRDQPYTGPERRQNRLRLMACPRCGHEPPEVLARTSYLIVLRCVICSRLWSVQKRQ
jgi:transcription elongation factor Elf1